MADMSPVWLLDVDGVINANRPGWGGQPMREQVWSRFDGNPYLLQWAPALVDRIRTLHLDKTVEVRWCTTWCPEVDQLERLWSLPALRSSLTANPLPRGMECWPLKLAAAVEVLAEGRPLIWTDDEAIPMAGPARDALTSAGRTLLIAPRPSRGLQPDHLSLIEAFAASP